MAEGQEQPLNVLVSSAGVDWRCLMVPDGSGSVSCLHASTSSTLCMAPIALAPLHMLHVCHKRLLKHTGSHKQVLGAACQ